MHQGQPLSSRASAATSPSSLLGALHPLTHQRAAARWRTVGEMRKSDACSLANTSRADRISPR
jgi:hypothetical protein